MRPSSEVSPSDLEALQHLNEKAPAYTATADDDDHVLSDSKLAEAERLLEGGDTAVEEAAFEHTISTQVKLALLACYLALNLALTLSTKTIFQRLSAPWMLTALHSTFAGVGCNAIMWHKGHKFTRLSSKDNLVIVAFSTLFTVNIAVSNVSLAMVSVPFHQTVRSSTPLFTVLLYRVVFGRQYSVWTQLALVPIVLGVCLLAYGDYAFSAAGFLLTFLGVLLASVKSITTNRILTGSRAMDPIEVLARMSPLAAVQSLVLGLASGECAGLSSFATERDLGYGLCAAVAANSMLAFLLNISSFKVNKLAGALAQTVSGNVKQCLTIALAIPMFGVQVGWIDGLGMITTMCGAALFSYVELRARK